MILSKVAWTMPTGCHPRWPEMNRRFNDFENDPLPQIRTRSTDPKTQGVRQSRTNRSYQTRQQTRDGPVLKALSRLHYPRSRPRRSYTTHFGVNCLSSRWPGYWRRHFWSGCTRLLRPRETSPNGETQSTSPCKGRTFCWESTLWSRCLFP